MRDVWGRITGALTDFEYLQARIGALPEQSQAPDDVFGLLADFVEVLAAVPKSQPRHKDVERLHRAIDVSSHFLKQMPALLAQQVYNSREWGDDELGVAVREVVERGGHSIQLRRLNHVQTPSPLIRLLAGHKGSVNAVADSPDGSRIVSGSGDGTAKIWDAETGQELLAFDAKAEVRAVAYYPDGWRIASGGGDTLVRVWDTRLKQQLFTLRGHGDCVAALAISADGSRLVSGSWDGTLKVWDSNTGKEQFTLAGHRDRVVAVAYGAEDTRIASGSWDKTVKVWDARTGDLLHTLKSDTNGVWAVAYSRDGAYLAASGATYAIRLWDARNGQVLRSLAGHAKSIPALAFSPDGSRLASGSRDRTVRVWDVGTGRTETVFEGHSEGVHAVAYNRSGARLLSGGFDGIVKVWDARGGRQLQAEGRKGIAHAAFTPDGTCLVSGGLDRTVKGWDVRTGDELFSLTGHTSTVLAVACGPVGAGIASRGANGVLRVGPYATGRTHLVAEGMRSKVKFRPLAWSRDGSRLAFGDGHTVRVWAVPAERELFALEWHDAVVQSVAFSPDGAQLASGGADKTVLLWDARTGLELRALAAHDAGIVSLAYSPDNRLLASGDGGGTLKVWDLSTGRQVWSLPARTGAVGTLAWEPKGTVLAAGDDRALRLYDARTGQALGAFPCLDVVLALWFHPAEPLLLAADRGCGTGVPNVYRLEVVTPPVPENRRDPG